MMTRMIWCHVSVFWTYYPFFIQNSLIFNTLNSDTGTAGAIPPPPPMGIIPPPMMKPIQPNLDPMNQRYLNGSKTALAPTANTIKKNKKTVRWNIIVNVLKIYRNVKVLMIYFFSGEVVLEGSAWRFDTGKYRKNNLGWIETNHNWYTEIGTFIRVSSERYDGKGNILKRKFIFLLYVICITSFRRECDIKMLRHIQLLSKWTAQQCLN